MSEFRFHTQEQSETDDERQARITRALIHGSEGEVGKRRDRLIRASATPDLLQALREILEDPDAKILDSHRDMGWAAIHKATGEQP